MHCIIDYYPPCSNPPGPEWSTDAARRDASTDANMHRPMHIFASVDANMHRSMHLGGVAGGGLPPRRTLGVP